MLKADNNILKNRQKQVSNFANENENEKQNYLPEKSVIGFNDKGLRKDLSKYIIEVINRFKPTEISILEGVWFEGNFQAWKNLFNKEYLLSSQKEGEIEVSKKVDIQQFIILMQYYKLFDENIYARLERQKIFYYIDKTSGEKVYVTKFEKGIKTLKERKNDIKRLGFPNIAKSGRYINSIICEIFQDEIPKSKK